MSSRDDVHRLRREGLSVRAIAAQLGLSRMKVHRTLTAPVVADLDHDDGLALLDAGHHYSPVGPFVFAGMDPEPGVGRKPVRAGAERILDGNGQSCNILEIWRADRTDDGLSKGYIADVDRQITEAGYRRVDTGDGYWRWERG